MKLFFTLSFLLLQGLCIGQIYGTIEGQVNFISKAPLEIITASSNQMQGLIDLDKKVFAFKIYIKSFNGFNSPLQQIHFYENYMEANDFPIATFKGKILEPIQHGKGLYRAKGILEIHGQSVERIIGVEMIIDNKQIKYAATFLIPLEDHDIQLPRIVSQKIAESIEVSVDGEMQLKE